ncbi:unnamed protein product [Plutella xylostella]|uniref:RNA-directed DNA polymerase n=1 Tax=Plutella xylostella TaxID=51655 RepID=A0A8S4F856_PLUXY|nr:unnamed protein product [Plutella xylostella]CAG9137854.1 unnamed protein product [Plutella xylostella]
MVLTEDQFTQLLAAVGPKKGSIASCQATYNGEKSSEAVESFLTAINIFKQLENISEKDAITGLPLLLHGNAGKWWQGVKDEITTWTEFEKSLRNSFAPKEPAHIIYQKILQGKQEVGTTTEDFITDKRMLFATLPKPQHPETQQIDMIYGLLNIKIRDKIPRTSFTTYDQLVELSRGIELLQLEKDDVHKPGTSKINITKHQGKGKGRCSFCKNPGHSVEVCRKRQRMENSREDPQDTASRPNLLALPITQPKVSCYGCGAPGVVRTKCPNCSQKTQIAPIKPEDISFCSLNATDARARPVVFITINGFNGVAYIDTGAKMSVASYELYRHLCNQGCGFKQKVLNVTLADGITKRQTVLLAKVRVTLSDKEITTEFMVMPESRDNRTLLGIGFLTDAAMVLNLGQASWHFAENPNEEFELYNEDFATFKEPTDNPVVAAVSNTGNDPSLRAEKSRRGPIYGATASTNLDSTVPWNYNLIRIADLPPTPKRSKIFDGYSPQLDYMMEDARVNVEQTEIQLSPHSQQLFPVNRSIDDVSICSINVGHDVALTKLTRKNVNWHRSEDQEIAFSELKRKLTTAPILRQADHTKPYIIKSNASNYALGAVLVQGEGAEEHPVEYAGRLLTSAEKNYSTTEREALAVIWAVTKFRGYIEGLPITVVTDHQALKWLMTLKSPTGRLARWALELQAYDITIKYIEGRPNVVADTLSRPFCSKETIDTCGLCGITIDMPLRDPKEIRDEQLKAKEEPTREEQRPSSNRAQKTSRKTQENTCLLPPRRDVFRVRGGACNINHQLNASAITP